MIPFYPPSDNQAYLLRYLGTKGGVCGPACIATLEHTEIGLILRDWLGKDQTAFRGFTPISEMKEMLTILGWEWEYNRGGKAKRFPTPSTGIAVVRIQWLQPDGKECIHTMSSCSKKQMGIGLFSVMNRAGF
jgi:hypothetical protein